MTSSSSLFAKELARSFRKLPVQVKIIAVILLLVIVGLPVLWPNQFGQLNSILQSFGLSVDSSPQSTPTPDAQQDGSSNAATTVSGQLYTVSKVVDGDTIKVMIDDVEQTIRLIGIDTPEVVDPRKTVECYGKEASSQMKKLVEGKQIKLESDPSQGNSDTYGRLLRYVQLSDGQLVNLLLIKNGYAFEYTYKTPYKYQAAFKSAQTLASSQRQGLWSEASCKGQRQIDEPQG